MKITIAGTLGSGKTTIAKMLSTQLKYKNYSAGIIFRTLSEQKNITLIELLKKCETDKTVDEEVEAYQSALGKREDNFILESRLGFYCVPDSLKIFLKCDENIAANRIIKSLEEKDSTRLKEGLKEDAKQIISSFHERRDCENIRYLKWYGITQDNPNNFDLIIDTSKLTPDEVCQKIILHINSMTQ